MQYLSAIYDAGLLDKNVTLLRGGPEMSKLCLAIIAALGIWAHYGNTGLGTAATMAAMIAAGVGVESFLNTFWKDKRSDAKEISTVRFWQPRRINILGKSLSPESERRAPQPLAVWETPELVPPASRRRGGLATEES